MLDLVRGLVGRRRRAPAAVQPTDAAGDVLKLLESAIANAEHNHSSRPDELFVDRCCATRARRRKWGQPRAVAGLLPDPQAFVAHHDRRSSRFADEELTRAPRRDDGAAGAAVPAAARALACRAGARVAAPRRGRGDDHDHEHDHDERRRGRRDRRPRPTRARRDAVEDTASRGRRRSTRSTAPTRPAADDRRRSDETTEAEADGDADDEAKKREANGSKGQPLRVPARHRHRLEVALDRRRQGVHATSSSRTSRSASTCASSSSAPR